MTDGSNDRLERIEQMQESNNKFLVAFSASVESLKDSVNSLQANVSDLTDGVRNTRIELREHRQELREHRRELREMLHRIDTNVDSIRDLQADTHELRVENQRILRYLESVNKPRT